MCYGAYQENHAVCGMSIHMSIHMPAYKSAHMAINMHAHMFVCMYVHMSANMSPYHFLNRYDDELWPVYSWHILL